MYITDDYSFGTLAAFLDCVADDDDIKNLLEDDRQ